MRNKKNDKITLTVEIEGGEFASEQWDDHVSEWAERAEKSRDIVASMSDEQRQQATWIFIKGLGLLVERIDEWFPNSISAFDGSYVDFTVRLAMMHVDQEVERSEIELHKQINKAKQELIALDKSKGSSTD